MCAAAPDQGLVGSFRFILGFGVLCVLFKYSRESKTERAEGFSYTRRSSTDTDIASTDGVERRAAGTNTARGSRPNSSMKLGPKNTSSHERNPMWIESQKLTKPRPPNSTTVAAEPQETMHIRIKPRSSLASQIPRGKIKPVDFFRRKHVPDDETFQANHAPLSPWSKTWPSRP